MTIIKLAWSHFDLQTFPLHAYYSSTNTTTALQSPCKYFSGVLLSLLTQEPRNVRIALALVRCKYFWRSGGWKNVYTLESYSCSIHNVKGFRGKKNSTQAGASHMFRNCPPPPPYISQLVRKPMTWTGANFRNAWNSASMCGCKSQKTCPPPPPPPSCCSAFREPMQLHHKTLQ